jgi:hypothetical protein
MRLSTVRPYVRAAAAFSTLVLAASASAQFNITGVADRYYNYPNSVTFTVNPVAGYDYLALLDTNAIPIGTPVTVNQVDYHELNVFATNQVSGAVSSRLVRFIVVDTERNGSENGLPPWTPFPTIPSSSAEFAGAHLRLITPLDFPVGYPIPIVAWVENEEGAAVRVNGSLAASGQAAVPIKRGVGSGFLEATNPAGAFVYAPTVGGLSSSRTINLEETTAWSPLSGLLAAVTVWPENSRIHVTGDLTIPGGGTLVVGAGTIVRVDAAADIYNSGNVTINGTTDRPVIFMPAVRGQPWGGFIQHANNASFTATAAVFTGSGANQGCWFTGHGCSSSLSGISSHRGEQALISLKGVNCNLDLTDCAAIYLAGQFAHSASGSGNAYSIRLSRTLVQRCTTGGEFTGALFTVNDSAFLEFYEDLTSDESSEFVDGDNDALYIVNAPAGQTHGFTNTLFGWTKDDGVDSGGSGAGRLTFENCWFDSILHEANSLSGTGKDVRHYGSVFLNCGQGLEAGYDAPTGRMERCLASGNLVGARFGDNYNWTYGGFLYATNSILIYNYRDVWGMNWADWTYRVGQMDVRKNLLTVPNSNHPDNTLWDPATDGGQLAPFRASAPGPVGIGLAVWSRQMDLAQPPETIPVRLSMFQSSPVSVGYAVTGDGAVLAYGTLSFPPGQTLAEIPMPAYDPANYSLVRVQLSNPVNAEITGAGSLILVSGISLADSLVPLGSVWKYFDQGMDLGTAWRNPDVDDSGWKQGPAELGYGDGDEATVVSFGPDANNKYRTTCFRRSFSVDDPRAYSGMTVRLIRDDGAVVYLNGGEVFRSNMPGGVINYSTFANNATDDGKTFFSNPVAPGLLVPGRNVLAVEIHQDKVDSSDISFNLELSADRLPALNLAAAQGELLLFWGDASFHLEAAEDLGGPWNPVSGATSPWPIHPGGGIRFFRLRQP